MKRFNIWQKILVAVLTVVFLLTVVFGVLRTNRVKELDTSIFNVFSSIRYTIFDKPTRLGKEWVEDFVSVDALREENDVLRENISALGAYQARISELERQNEEYKELLEFKKSHQDYDLLSAHVVFRDFERWNNVIKVNVGSASGVKVNDAVITAEGLVGRVETVEEETSLVRLIISNDKVSKVAVKIELSDNKTVEAIIDQYDANTGMYKLSLLDKNDNIKKDDKVVTSGAGGTIPGGLLVGHINSLEQSINELADDIYVRPSANFDDFQSVFVVRGKAND